MYRYGQWGGRSDTGNEVRPAIGFCSTRRRESSESVSSGSSVTPAGEEVLPMENTVKSVFIHCLDRNSEMKYSIRSPNLGPAPNCLEHSWEPDHHLRQELIRRHWKKAKSHNAEGNTVLISDRESNRLTLFGKGGSLSEATSFCFLRRGIRGSIYGRRCSGGRLRGWKRLL